MRIIEDFVKFKLSGEMHKEIENLRANSCIYDRITYVFDNLDWILKEDILHIENNSLFLCGKYFTILDNTHYTMLCRSITRTLYHR